MGLNVQTIGRPGGLLSLRSNAEFTYFVFDYEKISGTSPNHSYFPKLVAGENDPNSGNALVVLTDFFTPVLFAVIEYDIRFWASSASAPGTLVLNARYADGGSLPVSQIDSQGWTAGCDSANGAHIAGGSKNIISALRNDGSKWGEIAISQARGGSTVSECSGNFNSATVLARVDTPKILSEQSWQDVNYRVGLKKL